MIEYYSQDLDSQGNIIFENGKPVSRALSDLIRFDRTLPPPDHDEAAWARRREERQLLIRKIESQK